MVAMRIPTVAFIAGITAILASGGCGGGNSGSEVRSEALVAESPTGCPIEADVHTGPDLASFLGGVCLTSVHFDLFDTAGNELPVQGGLYILAPDRELVFHLHICSGQAGMPQSLEPFVDAPPPGPPSLFLVADVDRCPTGTTVDGVLGIDVSLASPLREVSCQDISRVETHVTGCGD